MKKFAKTKQRKQQKKKGKENKASINWVASVY